MVALVITIIILLILAGISIAQLTGSGLFENAKLAEQKSKEAQEKEEGVLADYENKIAQYIDGTRTATGEPQLLATVTQTDFTEFEIPNLDSYKCFVAYIKYPKLDIIVQEMTFYLTQLKNTTSTSIIQPTYWDGASHYGQIYYLEGNKINACVESCTMEIYGIK